MIAGAIRERHEGVRDLLFRVGDKASRIHHQNVPDVVAPVPPVEHRSARIIAHAAASRFVGHAAQRIGRHLLVGENLGARGLQNLLDPAIHFVKDRERVRVLGRGVEPHLGNPEPVREPLGIDFHVIRAQGQTFAVASHADASRIKFLDLLLVSGAEARQPGTRTGAHPAAGVEVEAPAAQVFLRVLVAVVVARNIQARFSGAVVVGAGTAGKLREKSADVVERHMLHEVAPQRATGVRQALREVAIPGVEQNPDRLHQRRGQHHNLAAGFVLRPVLCVDVTYAASLARGRVHKHRMDGGVGAQREVGPPLKFRNHYLERAVTRPRITAIVARSAIVASGPPVVRLAQDGERLGQHLDAKLFGALLDEHFAATRVKRREQMLPTRRVRDVLGTARHPDQILDFVVVRRHVLVADRPVFAPTVLQALGLEVERAEAVAAASPQQRSPAHGAQPRPGEFRAGRHPVGVFFGNGVEVVRPLLDLPLHALRRVAVLAGLAAAAIGPLVRELVGIEILGGVDHAPGFKAQHVQTLGG